jgi:tRNA pseudouridine55 synthase
LVDKPQGWTSHDVVAVARKRLPRGTKVGHCGTLDPMATGLLMLLIGPWTRLQDRFQGLDKVYTGLIRLGVKTDTGDVTGKVLAEKPVPALTLPLLQAALDKRHGRVETAAPAYSAVKHEGKKLYEYARAGVEVPVKPRVCTVKEWKALSYAGPDLAFRLDCTSGTYVRSLAELVGEDLGCGATVAALRRESVDRYSVAGALPGAELKTLAAEELRRRLDSQAL